MLPKARNVLQRYGPFHDIPCTISELPPGLRVKRGDRVNYTVAPDQRRPEHHRAIGVQLRQRGPDKLYAGPKTVVAIAPLN